MSETSTRNFNLAEKRFVESKRHFNQTMDSIYRKYSKDSTDVGDEIDIFAGEIVVDRGHVTGMKDGCDDALEAGKSVDD